MPYFCAFFPTLVGTFLGTFLASLRNLALQMHLLRIAILARLSIMYNLASMEDTSLSKQDYFIFSLWLLGGLAGVLVFAYIAAYVSWLWAVSVPFGSLLIYTLYADISYRLHRRKWNQTLQNDVVYESNAPVLKVPVIKASLIPQREAEAIVREQRRAMEEDQRKAERAQRREEMAWGHEWSWKLLEETKLQMLSNSLLHLFDGMPQVKVTITNEPIHGKKKCDPSSAYAQGDKKIFVKKDTVKSNANRLHYIMLHEMTHNWVYWKGYRLDDHHGPVFQKKFKEVLNAK